MKTGVYITGVGVISAIGNNFSEHKKNLFKQIEGIKKQTFTNNDFSLDSYVGAVVSDLNVPEKYKDETRNFKFAFLAFKEALESSNIDLSGKRIAICLGTSLGGKIAGQKALDMFEKKTHHIPTDYFEKRSLSHIADELIAYYNLKASYYVISTACSASNNAVILGMQLLQDEKCDVAICGGCDELSDISLAGFTSLGAINTKTPSQPYTTGNGISLGEGAGFVVLEKTKRGEFAKILGGSITSDAYHITAPKSTGEGATEIAYNISQQTGIPLHEIDYINGHGTGTSANDNMEKAMIRKVFDETTLVSSTKGQTGHTLGAAGVIELINCVAAIQEKKIPKTLVLEENRKSKEKNFVNDKNVKKNINYALNFSFAFGGNNSGILLGEPNSLVSTFKANQDVTMTILSNASTIEEVDNDKKNKYISKTIDCSNITALRYNDFSIPNKVNPAQYRKMDNFSKMVVQVTAKAIGCSGLDLKKMDASKVGIVFTTSSGPLEVVETIENQIRTKGYTQVSAAKFPFTVMNAAVGMLSILFKIKGPVSVISSDVGSIDGLIYAEEMMRNENLSHVLLVSAMQWTDLSLVAWEQLDYDCQKFVPADYCNAMVITNGHKKNHSQILASHQLKYDNKYLSKDIISGYFCELLDENLKQANISEKDIKGIIWNSNKKINTIEYEFFEDLTKDSKFPVYDCSSLGFSSDGAGEELTYLLHESSLEGVFLLVSFARFGGISCCLIRKDM